MTDRGIDAVGRHIVRFGSDEANQVMVNRLRDIARGEIEPTQYDLNYYSQNFASSSDTADKDFRRERGTITNFGTMPIQPPCKTTD